jgi:hypothetical protein
MRESFSVYSSKALSTWILTTFFQMKSRETFSQELATSGRNRNKNAYVTSPLALDVHSNRGSTWDSSFNWLFSPLKFSSSFKWFSKSVDMFHVSCQLKTSIDCVLFVPWSLCTFYRPECWSNNKKLLKCVLCLPFIERLNLFLTQTATERNKSIAILRKKALSHFRFFT